MELKSETNGGCPANHHRDMKLKDPKTLRVFFSSPFGGMEEEREELTRKYFPQFQHACNVRGIQFVPVDMRWGITTEAADNAQVVNICLREIDRSDVFIGFFGQRYGWHGETDALLQQNMDNAVGRYPFVDQARGKSVTELEFLHGHLNQPGKLPAAICFRDKAYDDTVREQALAKGDKKGVFKYTAESDHASELMQDLIERVKATEKQCLGVFCDYKTPHEGAKFMFDSVWECCLKLLESSQNNDLSPLQQNRLCHDAYMSSLTSLYLGGEEYLAQLTKASITDSTNILVTGVSGSGKSALLANFVSSLTKGNSDTAIVYHFIGSAQDTTDPTNIVQRIVDELQDINKSKKTNTDDIMTGKDGGEGDLSGVEERASFRDLYLKMQNEITRASHDGRRVVIVIDGLNKVTAAEKTAKPLYWLPSDLPGGVSLVVSTLNSDQESQNLLVTEAGYTKIEVVDISEETCKDMCQKSLMVNGKELSPEQLERIVATKQNRNPLFLKVVLSEISIYGYFRLLDKKIDSLISSANIKELLEKVLQRLEEDYNMESGHNDMVQKVLSALAVAHSGLSEAEILGMYKIPSNVWSPFYFAMENFLINDSGVLRFSFPEFKEAVEARYLNGEDQRKYVKYQLIYFFKDALQSIETVVDFSNMALSRVASELPWLQQSVGDKPGLASTLSHIGVFHVLGKKSVYELIDLWASTDLDQNAICDRLLGAIDVAICDLYNQQLAGKLDDQEPPGYVLLPVLKSISNLFDVACMYQAHIRTIERIVELLERIKHRLEPSVAATLLRDNHYFLACAYANDTRYDMAQPLHQAVMEECRRELEKAEDPRLQQTLAFTCNGLGVIFLKQKKYKEAEPLFLESIKYHTLLGNDDAVATAKTNIGVIKMDNEEPELALQYFNESLASHEKENFGHLPLEVGNLLTNMAICHRRMGEVEKAEAMFFRSLEVKAAAVGWTHQVIANCYMNLGVLEVRCRNNYVKGAEYNQKAIDILEMNKVKLEQGEMWMTLENLVLYKVCENKHAEALPVFRRVFSMLEANNWVDLGCASVHQEMLRYLVQEGHLEEASNIALNHLAYDKTRTPTVFVLLDVCDSRWPAEKRPHREKKHTVQYALDELWPGNNELSAYIAQTYKVPAKDKEGLLRIVKSMDEHNPDFGWSTYDVAAIWCENTDKQMAVEVLQIGLERYPDSGELKTKLFDYYRQLNHFDLAYGLLQEVLTFNPDNQAIILLGGQVAMYGNELDLCKELWEKAATMEDEFLAEKAKNSLQRLEEIMKEMKETEDGGGNETQADKDSNENQNTPDVEDVKTDEGEAEKKQETSDHLGNDSAENR